ncbi:MAG TPA: cysteine desulfurase NifS [Verrucomicrobiae bacterium]|nr:cysteine desulfurase NifS [Verrucomicrobiae bacterium]
MNEPSICYFDNNATTRVAPEVVDAMVPFLRESWGNPSSLYGFGKQLAKPLEIAREKIAALIHAEPREIIFTSCGTESNNSAIHSALVMQPKKRHVVTTAVEHPSNIKFCAHLKKMGFDITLLPVDSDGALDMDLLEKSIRPDTAIVSVMLANNETGVLFPLAEIAAVCRGKHVLFHTDAVQASGKIKTDVADLGVDFLSLSAHKLHAPKGVGALYVKRGTKYQPYLIGGGQEQGRRGGTENTSGIVGFGRAAELAEAHLEEVNTRVRALRDKLENGILNNIQGVVRNGAPTERLPNTSNLSFEGLEAEGILLLLDELGICASSGSACTSGSLDPSHVLLAMGCSVAQARGSVRFSLGIYNTEAEVDFLLKHLPTVISKLRSHAPSGKALTRGSHVAGTKR